ncbi:MAG: FAD-binding oxidoreductase [Kiloniellales bacterium]
MKEDAKVVIVGGGIVGCSLLYWLTRMGWGDCLLLERLELTSGSTWHAAGNVTHFGHRPDLTRLYVDSIKSYLDAEAESGQVVGFHKTGSLRLATTPAELAAYRRFEADYRALGVPYRVVDPAAAGRLHPLLNIEGILGAAHTPDDGHVDPSGATYALAKAAKLRGAGIATQTAVTAIEATAGGWRVETAKGSVRAEHVVLAASFWTRELSQPLGLSLPLYPLQHHEVVTGDHPELVALKRELPTVRDPYGPSNTRQERNGFLCGVYESDPAFWALDGIPPEFGQELLPSEMERLEPNLLRVMERIPAFGEAGIKAVNNGPICYTPDASPLVGPLRSHPGLWVASGFAVGIGTGGGAAKLLAGWMVEGKPAHDASPVDPARFPADLARAECLRQIRETYAAGYALPPMV